MVSPGRTRRNIAYDAIDQMDAVLPDQTFEESADFTMRWAGADFFKNWRDGGAYSHPGWDLSNALAVAYKHDNGPWDPNKYPNNEIYFNTGVPWSYSIFDVEAGKYDFWTILLHEIIHMLACDAHATHPDEVMYESIGLGQRKFLKLSDLDILIGSGYSVTPGTIRSGPVPEPPGMLILASGLILLLRSRSMKWNQRKRG